jgi:hypothetical protein
MISNPYIIGTDREIGEIVLLADQMTQLRKELISEGLAISTTKESIYFHKCREKCKPLN